MKTFAFVAPVLPGKLAQMKSLIATLTGPKLADAQALRRKAGLEREQIFVQETPMGEFAIVVWDTNDLVKVFETFATDTAPTTQWFREQLLEIHGIDVTQAASQPQVVNGFDWADGSWSIDGDFSHYSIMFPVKPGKEDAILDWAHELEARKADFVRTREEIGVHRQTFIRHTLPDGTAMAIMYGEGEPRWIDAGWKLNATSNDPFIAWFRESMREVAAVPMFTDAGTPPKVTQLLELRVPATVKA
jgi:hypothetical protein